MHGHEFPPHPVEDTHIDEPGGNIVDSDREGNPNNKMVRQVATTMAETTSETGRYDSAWLLRSQPP